MRVPGRAEGRGRTTSSLAPRAREPGAGWDELHNPPSHDGGRCTRPGADVAPTRRLRGWPGEATGRTDLRWARRRRRRRGPRNGRAPARAGGPRGRTVRRLVAAAAILVAAAGCSDAPPAPTATSSSVPAGSAAPAPGAVPAGLERFYTQRPAWGSCLPLATTDDQRQYYAQPGLQCAKIEVPVDYANPQGPTAQLAISRLRPPTRRSASARCWSTRAAPARPASRSPRSWRS